jgi:regulator of sigma E protease
MKPETIYRGELGFRPKQGREIKAVRPNSLAQQLGVKTGSSLLSIHGQVIQDLSDIKMEDDKKNFELVLATQDGEQKIMVESSWKQFMEGLHIGKSENENVVEVAQVRKGALAEKMGLKQGDQVLAFQIGKSEWISDPSIDGLIYSIASNKEQTIQLKVKRSNGQEILMSSQIGLREEPYYLLGLEPQVKVIEGEFLKTTVLWPLHLLRMTYKSLIRMFSGKVSAKHISGPVGIAKMTYAMADSGLSNLFYFMAILSISIAFFNCLPIPVLDGGQLLFCLIEWVKGSPVSERFMLKFQYLGFALILALLVFATWNDINSKF